MHILILGGTGFIGSRVLQALKGHEVTVYHRSRQQKHLLGVRHIHGDREHLGLHRAELSKLQPDVVLDMIPYNESDAQHVVNNLSDVSARIVAISSISVYRSFGIMLGIEQGKIDNRPATEEDPLRTQLYPYQKLKRRIDRTANNGLKRYDKIAAERIYLSQPGLLCSIIRLPMVYGPGDKDHRLAPYLRRMIDKREAIYLQKAVVDWRNSRGFVDNVALAITAVVLKGEPGQAYNYAEPEDFTEADWIREMGRHLNWQGEIRTIPNGLPFGFPSLGELPLSTNFAQHLRMDSDKIRKELDYTEILTVKEALKLTIDDEVKLLPTIDYSEENRMIDQLLSGSI